MLIGPEEKYQEGMKDMEMDRTEAGEIDKIEVEEIEVDKI